MSQKIAILNRHQESIPKVYENVLNDVIYQEFGSAAENVLAAVKALGGDELFCDYNHAVDEESLQEFSKLENDQVLQQFEELNSRVSIEKYLSEQVSEFEKELSADINSTLKKFTINYDPILNEFQHWKAYPIDENVVPDLELDENNSIAACKIALLNCDKVESKAKHGKEKENINSNLKICEINQSASSSYMQTRSKTSDNNRKSTNLTDINSVYAKPRLDINLLKRKRKSNVEIITNCNTREIRPPVCSISLNGKTNVMKFSLKNNIDSNTNSKDKTINLNKKTDKSIHIPDVKKRNQPPKVKDLAYCTRQEITISRALTNVGITVNQLENFRGEDNIKIWQCHLKNCKKQFFKLCFLKTHLLTHFGIKPFKCDYEGCTWAFYTEDKLKRHKDTHLKKKENVCSIPGCKRRFSTYSNKIIHEKLHSRPSRLSCQVLDCAAKFQTQRALDFHMKSHEAEFAPYVCDLDNCGKRFYSTCALISHLRAHNHSEKEVTCSWVGCGKRFDLPSRLKMHMLSHTGSKPYACTFKGCKWAFSTSSKLKRHQRKHTNERKFVCDQEGCNKAFMRSEHLREHKLTHAERSFFECHICSSTFLVKSSLYSHMRRHAEKGLDGSRDRSIRAAIVKKKADDDVSCPTRESIVPPENARADAQEKRARATDEAAEKQQSSGRRLPKRSTVDQGSRGCALGYGDLSFEDSSCRASDARKRSRTRCPAIREAERRCLGTNEGSARTAYTREEVIGLKSDKRVEVSL